MINIFNKTYEVLPNTVGFLYKNNAFLKELKPGIYDIWDFRNRTKLYTLPITKQWITVTNQEVLTKDNISLRFSFNIVYKITDGRKVLENISIPDYEYKHYILSEIETILRNIIQIHFRKSISEIESELLNEKRNELITIEKIKSEIEYLGLEIENVEIRDISFPKSIQELFAKHLESKIRTQTELENARTAIATARALKNASELMKGDENIKFFQMMETISKIASKGKHTFVIGDINPLTK